MNEYARIPPRGFEGGRPNFGMQLPQFGMGSMSGIQSAFQPLRVFISNQIHQQTNEKINPFIEEVATNAQETFDIQSGPQLGSLLQSNNMLSPYQPAVGFEGIKSLFQPAQNPAVVNENNYNRAVPMANGGYVYSGGFERGRGDSNVPIMDENMLDFQKQQEEQQRQNDADDRAAKFAEQTLQGKLNASNVPVPDATGTQRQIDARREARKRDGIRNLFMNTPDPDTGITPNQQKRFATNQTTRFYNRAMDRPKRGFFSELVMGSMPAQIFRGIFDQKGIMRDKLQQQGNYSADGGFGIGSFLNKITNTRPVDQVAIRDQMGKVIGVVGFNEKGTPVSHTGKLSGYMDAYQSDGKGTISQGELVDFGQDNQFGLALGPNSGTSDDGPDDTLVSPTTPVTCPDGYVYDSITNSCVAVESTAEETETTEASPIVVDPNVTVPTEYPLFNQGGVASLNDVARNMSRGPRGIAGYQTYMR